MTRDPSLDPSLDELLDEAHRREASGDAAGALALLDGATDDMKASGVFHYARGALLVRKREFEPAIGALERAVELEPDIPEMAGNLGAAYLERLQARGADALSSPASADDLRLALVHLEAAARAAPQLAEVTSNLGRALTLAGRTSEALHAFDRALAVDPTHLPALYNKAAALHAAGKPEAALAVLDELLRIAPDFEPARVSRANTLKRLGRA